MVCFDILDFDDLINKNLILMMGIFLDLDVMYDQLKIITVFWPFPLSDIWDLAFCSDPHIQGSGGCFETGQIV